MTTTMTTTMEINNIHNEFFTSMMRRCAERNGFDFDNEMRIFNDNKDFVDYMDKVKDLKPKRKYVRKDKEKKDDQQEPSSNDNSNDTNDGNEVKPKRKYVRKKKTNTDNTDNTDETKEVKPKRKYVRKNKPNDTAETTNTTDVPKEKKKRGRKPKNPETTATVSEDFEGNNDLVTQLVDAAKKSDATPEETVNNINNMFNNMTINGENSNNDTNETSDEEDVVVEKVTIEGKDYLKDSQGKIYNIESHDYIGTWNSINNTIENNEELQEEQYIEA